MRQRRIGWHEKGMYEGATGLQRNGGGRAEGGGSTEFGSTTDLMNCVGAYRVASRSCMALISVSWEETMFLARATASASWPSVTSVWAISTAPS